MIISHEHKFIFIKTRKTAGTSIEVYLSRHCGPSDVVTPIIPHVEPHVARNAVGYFNHMPAFKVRDRIGRSCWDSYFKFCVERNPWDKTLSHFYMKRARENPRLTFDEYLAEKKFVLDVPAYTEPGNPSQIIVDEVIYYESLAEDIGRTFKRLGIPFNGSLGVNAKSEYRTDRRHYHDVYTPEQARIVGTAFKQELSLHDYAYGRDLPSQ